MITFQESYYERALIGVSTDERAVYSYETMIECLMAEEGMSYEEAQEWLEYNTIGAVVKDGPIIIIRKLEEEDYG